MPEGYSYAEQARHYRQAARDRGCTCPDLMAPHTHLIDCLLFEVPGGTPRTFHRHAPAGGVTISPPGGHAAKPVSSTTETETEPEGAGKDSPPSGAGAFDRFIAGAVEDSINAYEREEDHAEERHSEGGL